MQEVLLADLVEHAGEGFVIGECDRVNDAVDLGVIRPDRLGQCLDLILVIDVADVYLTIGKQVLEAVATRIGSHAVDDPGVFAFEAAGDVIGDAALVGHAEYDERFTG